MPTSRRPGHGSHRGHRRPGSPEPVTDITGLYDLVGDVLEIVNVDGRIIMHFDWLPDRFAPTLRPISDSTYVIETSGFAGAELAFRDGRVLLGGVLPMERIAEHPPAPAWPSGKGLTLDEPPVDPSEEDAYSELWNDLARRTDGHSIDWKLPWAKHRFVEWLSGQGQVIFHGSPRSDLDLFIPRRESIELFDYGGRGNRGAVYGTPYGLWSMWFAVIDRPKLEGSIRNGVLTFEDADGNRVAFYNFSVHYEFVNQPIWRTGTLYLLPAEPFTAIPYYPGGPDSNEWASTAEVRPIARLEIRPEDFPFIDRVGGHDDSELIAANHMDAIVATHVKEALSTEKGFTVRLAWDDEIAGIMDAYIESGRKFTPDVVRRHRIEGDAHWLDLHGPSGFLQSYEQKLIGRGIPIRHE